MQPNSWWVLAGAVFVGHLGLNIAIYNRLNATGWPRRFVKKLTRAFFAETLLLPILVVIFCRDLVGDLWSGSNDPNIPVALWWYSLVCLGSWFVFGIPWLLWRPILGLESIDAPRSIDTIDVAERVSQPLALSTKCKLEQHLPMNQIFDLSVEQIELPVASLPPALDGYRIAQISDIHLTGHIHSSYTEFVMQRASSWHPDLMAITGDIIDRVACIEWIPSIFGSASACDGCYFVLGNHDKLIGDPAPTRDAMTAAGWINLGGRSMLRSLRDVPVELIGNEYPWLERPQIDADTQGRFRLLLSHSPDQLTWARRNNVALMLAGHTHGGQGRLPLAGPILSPSYHGSRYAAGDFYRKPTTMHVSRGLSGSHVVRFRCRPELSLITLRVPSDRAKRT